MRLRAELIEQGPATASQLAARTGESSGATSYHLRQLAAYGFVVEDDRRGRGRERYWQAIERSASLPAPNGAANGDRWSSSAEPKQPGNGRAADAAAATSSKTSKFGTGADEPWERCEWFLDMTAEESEELSRQFHELCLPYSYGHRERPEGARRVRVQFLLCQESDA